MRSHVLFRRGAVLVAVAVAVLLAGAPAGPRLLCAQEAAPLPAAASGAALLPVYGVDLELNPAWVDASAYPSASPAHPHQGVSAAFQLVWQTLAASGVNTLRVSLDVGEPLAAGVRLANLVTWAEANGAMLLPMLVQGSPEAAVSEGFPAHAAEAVRACAAALARQGRLAAYGRIVLLQVGRDANHAGRNGRLAPDAAAAQAVAAAAAVRAAESAVLAESGLYLTPILVQASADYELVRAGAMAGAALAEDTYAWAYRSLSAFLAAVAAAPEVDALGVSWYPGSIGSGGPERFPALLSSLAGEYPAKQLLLTTGCSTAFRSPEEQRQLVALAFANVADLRASQGDASPVVGLLFHHAARPATGAEAPPEVAAALAAWDPTMRAPELAQTWLSGASSPELAWWERRTEEEMGLLTLSGEPGAPSVATQPGADALAVIASAVGEAVGEALAGGEAQSGQNPGLQQKVGAAVGSLVTQVLGGVLDKVFARLAGEIDEAWGTGGGGSGGGGGGGTAGTASGGTSGGAVGEGATAGGTAGGGVAGVQAESVASSAPVLTIAASALSPSPAIVGQPASVSVSLHNAGGDASGLALGLLDAEGFLVAEDALAEGVSVAAQGDAQVSLPWSPLEEGTLAASVTLYDANWAELASGAVTLAAEAPAAPGPTPGATPGPTPGAGPRPGPGKIGINPALVGAASSRLVRPGFPGVGELRVTRTGSGQALISLPLSNSGARSLFALAATLYLGDTPVETRSLDLILPQQTRTVAFAGVALPAGGAAALKVTLKRSGAAPFVAAARRVEVAGLAAAPALRAPAAATKGAKLRLAAPSAPSADAKATPAAPALSKPAAMAVRPVAAPLQPLPTPALATAARPAPGMARAPSFPPATPTAKPALSAVKAPPALAVRPTPTPRPALAAQQRTAPSAPLAILRPDPALAAGDLHVTPAVAAAGQRLAVRADVRNLGSAPAEGVRVSFSLANAAGTVVGKGDVTVGSMAAHTTRPVSWSVTLPAGGPWRVTAVVRATADAQSANNQAAVAVGLAKALSR